MFVLIETSLESNCPNGSERFSVLSIEMDVRREITYDR